MIDYIRGLLTEKEIAHVTVEAHGVGYAVGIPLSTYEKLPAPGADCLLHIHYHVREDAHKLYGFFSKDEREMFRLLIAITGIGPKVALSVLSGITISDLTTSVNSSDSSRLEKIPGIGAKTAQRMIMELKGKLGKMTAPSGANMHRQAVASNLAAVSSISEEAFAAMISLGYNEKQVGKAIARVEETIAGNAPIEEWIRKALQVI